MDRFPLLAATLSATLLLSNAAQAIEIRRFEKMADADQDEYVADLVVGAQKVFKDEGKPDLAEHVHTLFTELKNSGDQISIGEGEFEMNLARARAADAQRAAQDPNAHRLEVEDAMLVTLQKNNIPLSPTFVRSFRAINNNFQPKSPPR